MSGTGTRHLEHRQGIFGLRVRVPDEIRPLVGLVEVRRSLRTYDPLRARTFSAVYTARLFEAFKMITEDQATLAPAAVKTMIAAGLREFVIDAVNCMTTDATKSRLTATPASPMQTPPAGGPTLEEAIAGYLVSKQGSLTLKTYKSNRSRLDNLKQHLGADTAIRAISAADIRSFRDAVCRLRRRTGRLLVDTFAAKQTENVADRIDGKTAILVFEPVKAFFRWAKSEQGYISATPAEDIRPSRRGRNG